MKLIDKVIPAHFKKRISFSLSFFLAEKNLVFLSGIMIQGFLILSIVFVPNPIVVHFFVAASLFYLLVAKAVMHSHDDIILYVLVFGFAFRFTASISPFLITNVVTQGNPYYTYLDEFQVFKDISILIGGDITKQYLLKIVVFIFEFFLVRVLFRIYQARKHFFIHYFWNIPIIYDFYFRPNLIVIFLFLFFFSLYLAINRRRFFSSIALAFSFFFNFGVFPFFTFFYKKIKWWLVLTIILCIGLVFIAGYYKILFSYMTTFQEIERGFISLLSFLKTLIPYPQIVLLLYYSFLISIAIYLLVREIYIFDSIYYFLLTLLLINPNKEIGFISFLLTFTVIFPNMGVIYFSLFLFFKIFLAKRYLGPVEIRILDIAAVITLYSYHLKIFFERVIHFYKRTFQSHKKIT